MGYASTLPTYSAFKLFPVPFLTDFTFIAIISMNFINGMKYPFFALTMVSGFGMAITLFYGIYLMCGIKNPNE